MKCPYAIDRQRFTRCNIEYDEETEQQKSWTETEINRATFVDCLEENCGAWQDGHCRYNQP